MTIYLSSFYPLCFNHKGKLAIITNSDLKPYIDGSCRREPDLENAFPCITGLCRPGFSKKLAIDDIVIYITNKKGIGSRKVVAILKVLNSFNNHTDAANWYRSRNKLIPNNLMVKETHPYPLNKTHQKMGWDSWIKGQTLKSWDKGYKQRAMKAGNTQVAQCEAIYKDLSDPKELDEQDWKAISSRPLCTQNPPIISDSEWQNLKSKLNSKLKIKIIY